jgi:hypothetical protein
MTSGPAKEIETARQDFWFVEMWKENREVFKELVLHVIKYLLLILILFASHYLLRVFDYPRDRKEIFDNIVYYAIVTSFVIFAVSFVMKLRHFEFPKKKNTNP